MEPSIGLLSIMIELSRRTIFRRLKELQNWNLLSGTRTWAEAGHRNPTRWQFGDALLKASTNAGRRAALEPKRQFLEERTQNKPEPNPEKTKARAIRMANTHLSGTPFSQYVDDLGTTVLTLPNRSISEAGMVLDDEIAEVPDPLVRPADVIKPRYASFAAKHTREDNQPKAA